MSKKELLEAVTVIIHECAYEHKYHLKYGVETLKEAREAFARDFNVVSRIIDKLGDYEGYVEVSKLYEELVTEISEMGETYDSLKNKVQEDECYALLDEKLSLAYEEY